MLAEPSDRRQRDANTSQKHPTTRNMDAWIDCLTYSRHEDDGMPAIGGSIFNRRKGAITV